MAKIRNLSGIRVRIWHKINIIGQILDGGMSGGEHKTRNAASVNPDAASLNHLYYNKVLLSFIGYDMSLVP